MPDFKFVRTMQYTEVVTVTADCLKEAQAMAHQVDGERMHDDTVVSLEVMEARHE